MSKKDKLWYRSRGLLKMESRFGRGSIRGFIRERIGEEKEIRILEIGFGEGKCLLDLRKLFPGRNVKLYGVNLKKQGNMHSRKDFLGNARRFGIKIDFDNLPFAYFYDAGEGLKFKDNYFDAVISQVAFHYVGNKAKLIEEIWRVLKVGGKAFIHIDEVIKKGSPDWMSLCSDTPRFVIYDKGKIISTESYLRRLRNKGYDIKIWKNKTRFIVLMNKTNKRKMKLNLDYDLSSSMDLQKVSKNDPNKQKNGIWWGTRSVFNIKH